MSGANPQRGFTLIEALVATALFAVVISAMTGAFFYTTQLSRRTNATRVANDNTRYITEFLAKEIRNGSINYGGPALSPCTASVPASANSLSITNVNGDDECFYLGTAGGVMNSTGPTLWIVKQPVGTLAPLAAQQLNISYSQVTSLTFLVTPALSSSIQLNDTGDRQPMVTVSGIVQSDKDSQNIVAIPFEFTVTLPEYDIAPH